MYSILLAATTGGAVDLSGVTAIVQSLADGLFNLSAPIAFIGFILAIFATLTGFQHGPTAIRIAATSTILLVLVKVLIPRLFAGG